MVDYIPRGIKKNYIFQTKSIYKSLIPKLENISVDRYWGWGRKPSFFRAEQAAQKHHGQSICVEDGFIRSLGLGKDGIQPFSLVVDRTGIYFDAFQPSDLENLIAAPENGEQNQRAKEIINLIKKISITKYNQRFIEIDPTVFQSSSNHILVVDQTAGDQSIHYAGASKDSFQQMLQQACQDHPNATIWIKTHPDVLADQSKGHFSKADLKHPNIRFITQHYNPLQLCQWMTEVYVVSSQLGFEALLSGKRVHCFGVPWYAGWGLTQDQHAPLHRLKGRRQQKRSLEHLFACAYLQYARYVSPVTQQRCELEDILEILPPNLKFQQKLPNEHVVAYGFSRWKRAFMADYLAFPSINLSFKQWIRPKKEQFIVAWGKKAAALKALGYPHVWTVEDGFLRSLGLGAKLIRPFSLVFDDVGIYYDATQPSRLEILLNQVQLNEQQQQRVQYLIQQIIENKLTKYNVGLQQNLENLYNIADRKKVLVVGQVEDDLSVQLGGVDIKTNLELIREVRCSHPNAYIIYKPHPDVQSGLRKGGIAREQIKDLVDHIETQASITRLFEYVDEVHTITSLSGFEALLRNITVYCYGIPFYAGWGLTVDRHICERRHRSLSLEAMVYAVLIEYPVYNLPHTKKMNIPLLTPEHVLNYMIQLQQQAQNVQPYMFSWLFTGLRKLKIKL